MSLCLLFLTLPLFYIPVFYLLLGLWFEEMLSYRAGNLTPLNSHSESEPRVTRSRGALGYFCCHVFSASAQLVGLWPRMMNDATNKTLMLWCFPYNYLLVRFTKFHLNKLSFLNVQYSLYTHNTLGFTLQCS